MDQTIKLHSGYFWSAGRSFKWNEDDPGVGIDLAKIRKALPDGKIYVESKYDKMHISARKALDIANKYKSYMQFGARKVAVIPKSEFIKDARVDVGLFSNNTQLTAQPDDD